jgi:hypothetical protein
MWSISKSLTNTLLMITLPDFRNYLLVRVIIHVGRYIVFGSYTFYHTWMRRNIYTLWHFAFKKRGGRQWFSRYMYKFYTRLRLSVNFIGVLFLKFPSQALQELTTLQYIFHLSIHMQMISCVHVCMIKT